MYRYNPKLLACHCKCIQAHLAGTGILQIRVTSNGQRSNEVVSERNKMAVKQVQQYIKPNGLVPDLMKMVDEKKMAFNPAVKLAFIKPENQRYIAVDIGTQQSAPSLSQVQRMCNLDRKKLLNPDMIDGIILKEKRRQTK